VIRDKNLAIYLLLAGIYLSQLSGFRSLLELISARIDAPFPRYPQDIQGSSFPECFSVKRYMISRNRGFLRRLKICQIRDHASIHRHSDLVSPSGLTHTEFPIDVKKNDDGFARKKFAGPVV
jgi:hypothetical protein